ncbi:MAG: UDP-N-acetylmuramoyl-tripeptide--D-alanyl-D-alanine ligase [Clostridia bacterium]|nr:UDP-N-acetylmuramoyl-tripeptide--D-alanyl-D-alanine ligase [Clostridia bacterium]
MQEFTIEEVRAACGGEYIKKAEGVISGVAIDSRKVSDGMLFVPIVGERVDGHDYISSALDNGAAASLSERDTVSADKGALIKVESSVNAIGKIAAAYKKKYNVPTVGVTGSVGKTTTKDMIAAVMSKLGACLKTEGNFNNELGLPLTVFRLKKEHKSAVLEMGMSAFGEIHHLVDIARPDVAVITNVGMSHIENLGSREGILKAKMEIADFFGKDNLLIINADNDMLKTVSKDKEYKILTYGIDEKADYMAKDITDKGLAGCSFTAVTPRGRFEIKLTAAGVHNVYNALSAIAVGEHFGISASDIADAVGNFELTKMRMTVEKYGNVTLINDCYNASYDSVKAGLEVLAKSKGRRVAVLGDVLELGDFAKETHLNMGIVCGGRADVVITAGNNAKYIAEGAKSAGVKEVLYYPTTEEAAQAAAKMIKDGDTVLVKASRGMKFEIVCNTIGDKLK